MTLIKTNECQFKKIMYTFLFYKTEIKLHFSRVNHLHSLEKKNYIFDEKSNQIITRKSELKRNSIYLTNSRAFIENSLKKKLTIFIFILFVYLL